jgi:hypothetical protein
MCTDELEGQQDGIAPLFSNPNSHRPSGYVQVRLIQHVFAIQTIFDDMVFLAHRHIHGTNLKKTKNRTRLVNFRVIRPYIMRQYLIHAH